MTNKYYIPDCGFLPRTKVNIQNQKKKHKKCSSKIKYCENNCKVKSTLHISNAYMMIKMCINRIKCCTNSLALFVRLTVHIQLFICFNKKQRMCVNEKKRMTKGEAELIVIGMRIHIHWKYINN